MKILFVCLGNICRSPTAEAVFRKKLHEHGISADFDSAGTHTFHAGETSDPRTVRQAQKRGYVMEHAARRVQSDDFATFDYIFAMDNHNLETLRALCPQPEFLGKIRLLTDFSDVTTYTEVPDPYYGDVQDFDMVLDIIDHASKGLPKFAERRPQTYRCPPRGADMSQAGIRVWMGFLVFVFGTFTAMATCGLKSCPIDMRRDDIRNNTFGTASASLMFGSFSSDDRNLNYATTSLHSDIRPFDWTRFSLTLPFASIESAGARHTGLGDILVEAAVSPLRWSEHKGMLWASLQAEFPTGDQEQGLGGGHIELLPYVVIHQILGSFVSYGQIGIRHSLLDHSHSESVPHTHSAFEVETGGLDGTVVNLHAGNEITFKAGSVYRINDRFALEGALTGMTILSADNRGSTFISFGPQLYMVLSNSLELNVRAEIPTLGQKRFAWQTGAGLSYSF